MNKNETAYMEWACAVIDGLHPSTLADPTVDTIIRRALDFNERGDMGAFIDELVQAAHVGKILDVLNRRRATSVRRLGIDHDQATYEMTKKIEGMRDKSIISGADCFLATDSLYRVAETGFMPQGEC